MRGWCSDSRGGGTPLQSGWRWRGPATTLPRWGWRRIEGWLTESDKLNAITRRFLVSFGGDAHRSFDAKTTRWSEWIGISNQASIHQVQASVHRRESPASQKAQGHGGLSGLLIAGSLPPRGVGGSLVSGPGIHSADRRVAHPDIFPEIPWLCSANGHCPWQRNFP